MFSAPTQKQVADDFAVRNLFLRVNERIRLGLRGVKRASVPTCAAMQRAAMRRLAAVGLTLGVAWLGVAGAAQPANSGVTFRKSAGKPASPSATSTAPARRNISKKRWAQGACSSTTTTMAGWMCSWLTEVHWPTRRSRARPATDCIATSATAPLPTSPRPRVSLIGASAWAPAPATTTTTDGSISTSPPRAPMSCIGMPGKGPSPT